MLLKAFTIAAAVGSAMAQSRPMNVSICDYYTTALLKNNTGENQYKLLTLVVNTAVIGNYTQPNVGIAVPGILAKGTYNGVDVNLIGFFNGMIASTNDGGSMGVSQNFLDDGGAAPLKMNKPSNGNMTSNQYMLLTHLYQYFGVLLGCTMQGNSAFYDYKGEASQYSVHKYMALDANQVGYFITQVGLAAASFGVAKEDVIAVGMSLNKVFNYKCAPPAVVVPAQGPVLESVCIADSCPLAPNAVCDKYEKVIMPMNATMSSSATGSSTSMASGTSTATGTAASASAKPTSGASALQVGSIAAFAGAMFAFAL